jgi:hypothetical protein
MAKQTDRWPRWKIVIATVGCAAAGGALVWVAHLVRNVEGEPGAGPFRRSPALTLSGVLMMLAIGAMILGLLGAVWLGYRIWEARTPAWKRRGKKGRR